MVIIIAMILAMVLVLAVVAVVTVPWTAPEAPRQLLETHGFFVVYVNPCYFSFLMNRSRKNVGKRIYKNHLQRLPTGPS